MSDKTNKSCMCGEEYIMLHTPRIADIAYYGMYRYILKDVDSLRTTEISRRYYVACKECGYLCIKCLKKSQEIDYFFTYSFNPSVMSAWYTFYSNSCINCTLPPK